MKKFRYEGPLTACTLRGVDYSLVSGAQLELPEDDEYVAELVRLGRLTPVPDPPPPRSMRRPSVAKTTETKGD